MEITYGMGWNCTEVFFRTWKDGKKYYFSPHGKLVFVPENGIIPSDCSIKLPTGISINDFEDAVIKLVQEIKERRFEPEIAIANPPMSGTFDCGSTDMAEEYKSMVSKFVNIIEKLLEV